MIAFGQPLNFGAGKPLPVVLRNFHEPEVDYVWSSSKWCELVFPFHSAKHPNAKACDLILELDVYKAAPTLPAQSIMVYLNGLRLGQYDVAGLQTLVMPLPVALLKATDNSLVIDTPQSAKPQQFGLDDDRVLGIQLFSVQIQPA